jgi:hypothetical protein
MECEIPQFYATSEPIARKVHRCCECVAPIEIGERHFLGRGKWDDKFNAYRQHTLCEKACEFVRDNFNGDECIGFGTLFEWLHEEVYELRRFKESEKGRQLRTMVAKIIKRERGAK